MSAFPQAGEDERYFAVDDALFGNPYFVHFAGGPGLLQLIVSGLPTVRSTVWSPSFRRDLQRHGNHQFRPRRVHHRRAVTAVTLVGYGVPLPLASCAAWAYRVFAGLVLWYAALRGAHRQPLVVQLIITIGASVCCGVSRS